MTFLTLVLLSTTLIFTSGIFYSYFFVDSTDTSHFEAICNTLKK